MENFPLQCSWPTSCAATTLTHPRSAFDTEGDNVLADAIHGDPLLQNIDNVIAMKLQEQETSHWVLRVAPVVGYQEPDLMVWFLGPSDSRGHLCGQADSPTRWLEEIKWHKETTYALCCLHEAFTNKLTNQWLTLYKWPTVVSSVGKSWIKSDGMGSAMMLSLLPQKTAQLRRPVVCCRTNRCQTYPRCLRMASLTYWLTACLSAPQRGRPPGLSEIFRSPRMAPTIHSTIHVLVTQWQLSVLESGYFTIFWIFRIQTLNFFLFIFTSFSLCIYIYRH